MDCKFVEILSKEELLKILMERKLDLPNMQEMSQSELIHIYKTFALPLARRIKHRTRSKPAVNSTDGNLNVGGGAVLMDIDETSESMNDTSNKTLSIASPFSERYATYIRKPREYKRVLTYKRYHCHRFVDFLTLTGAKLANNKLLCKEKLVLFGRVSGDPRPPNVN